MSSVFFRVGDRGLNPLGDAKMGHLYYGGVGMPPAPLVLFNGRYGSSNILCETVGRRWRQFHSWSLAAKNVSVRSTFVECQLSRSAPILERPLRRGREPMFQGLNPST